MPEGQKLNMDGNRVVDLAASPKTQATLTAAAWSIGSYTAQEWLTALSIFAVIIQILISLPKLYQLVFPKKEK